MPPTNPRLNVESLQRSTESLFKLLGGTPDDRLRFWEILKGITTPAVARVVQSQIAGLDAQLKTTQEQLHTLQSSAKELG